MSYDLRKPQITSPTEQGQLLQIKSYLYQLVEQLQFALNSIDTTAQNVVKEAPKSTEKAISEVNAEATFNSIKSLIIKSADIVEAFYQEVSKRLDGDYLAVSDFGTFREHTSQEISANSTNITTVFENLQSILTDISNIEHSLIDVNAYLRLGLLYTNEQGVPIYGVEVGQKNTIDGVEVFNQFARFTADKLSFYDQNGYEVAYISDYKLYITHAEVTGTLRLGAFEINTTNGFRLKYVGRE